MGEIESETKTDWCPRSKDFQIVLEMLHAQKISKNIN
jgi:hypothetical protein